MSRRVRDWCQICRDTDPDLKCVNEGCGRKFHESCLVNLALWVPGTKRDDFICPDCKDANVNDGTCYVCHQDLYVAPSPKKQAEVATDDTEEDDEDDEAAHVPRRSSRLRQAHERAAAEAAAQADEETHKAKVVTREEVADIEGILLCDGCPNSAHKACLSIPDDQQREDDQFWFCTECDPHGTTAVKLAEDAKATPTASPGEGSSASPAVRTKLGGNVDICYVCQKGGKLLGCDFCEQSYHPRCIESDYLEFEAADDELEAEKWRCPLCKGEDPLKSMGTRRLSRTAMLRMQREMQACIQQQHRNSKANRDKFLWGSRHALKPFMTEKAMSRLTRVFGKRRQDVVDEDDDTEDEDSGHVKAMDRLEQDAVRAYREALKYTKKVGLLKEGVQLKPYQIVGVGWLLHSFFNKAGAILADEMGLGKTVQCLAFISALKAMGITGPHLIVVPLSTVGNWAREIRRFVPHLKFVKICGSRFERDHIMADLVAAQGLHDLYITTYETIVTEESFFCDNFDWQCVILDEAHRIKNQTGRIRHSLDRVSANMRVLLTGTPLQNNIKELFTLLNFMFPEILEHSDNFERAFMKPPAGGSGGGSAPIEDTIDKKAMDAVSHLLSKMMLRRTKDLVVRLPRKVEHDLWLPLSPTGAYWYKKLLDVSDIDHFESQSTPKLLGTVIKMRICTCHPKGLVSKDDQFQKFKEMLSQHYGDDAEVDRRGHLLKTLAGEAHVQASNKLVTLDKLLMELHIQNMDECHNYRKAFEQNLRDLYVQAHPLPPIPVQKAKPRRKAKSSETKSEPAKSDGAKSETAKSDAQSEPADDLPVTEEVTLTARQLAEKARKERQALMSQQQKEQSEECERVIQETIARMSRFRQDVQWLKEAMLPGQVSDAPIPVVKALLEERDDDDEDESSPPTVIDDEATPEKSFEKGDDVMVDDEAVLPPPTRDEEVMESADVCVSADVCGDEPKKPAKFIPHKVLVFTQFQLVLDELEAYCKFRGFKYLRLDGSTNKMIRELDIREFNSPDSNHLVYLICTRAGGVGINLVTANHVVLFDEDWNPFMDLQAIDRAHRIGQKREVHVWKLVTEWTVEERMAFRRLQKLQLDKLFIQANNANQADVSEIDEEEEHTEKFSVDEIRRLIRYGKEAIQGLVEVDGSNNLANKSLTELMERPRCALPIDETSEEEMAVIVSDSDEQTVVLPVDAQGVPENASEAALTSSRPCSDDEDTATDAGGQTDSAASLQPPAVEDNNQRSRRLRRRIPIFQAPPSPVVSKTKQEKKIIHDKRCFRCGCGNNAMDEHADPLIACHSCPRVYHMKGCLGFDAPPRKTWVCQWHECSLCFRKGSQAGGLLIHCGECPTTFCFDCFPPEYKRWHPPATYFSELTRRGYKVSPEKLVLFLCSRCKALKEQARRRLLSKQQMDVEMRKRREVQEKARRDAQQRIKEAHGDDEAALALATALAKRGGDIKKNFLARKKLKDEQDRDVLNAIRQAYELLFPEDFIGVLKEKRANQIASRDAAKQEQDGAESKGKLLVSKLPSEYCKVCDNCHLPGHEAPICPFPAEAIKEEPAAAAAPDTAPPSSIAAEEGASPKEAEKPTTKKSAARSYCPKCGVSSRNHCRRHCDLLNTDEKTEYEARSEKVARFIECLKNAPPARLPENFKCTVANAESCRRMLQRDVDHLVHECLRQAGLESCISTVVKPPPGRRKKRRVSDNEDSALDESDEEEPYDATRPAASPRKRIKSDDEGAAVSDSEARQPRPARRRTKAEKPDTEEDALAPRQKKAKTVAPAAQRPVPVMPIPAGPPPVVMASRPGASRSSPLITAFLRPTGPQTAAVLTAPVRPQQTVTAPPPHCWPPAPAFPGMFAGGAPPRWSPAAAPPPAGYGYGLPPTNQAALMYGWSNYPPMQAPGPIRQVGLNQNGLNPPANPPDRDRQI